MSTCCNFGVRSLSQSRSGSEGGPLLPLPWSGHRKQTNMCCTLLHRPAPDRAFRAFEAKSTGSGLEGVKSIRSVTAPPLHPNTTMEKSSMSQGGDAQCATTTSPMVSAAATECLDCECDKLTSLSCGLDLHAKAEHDGKDACPRRNQVSRTVFSDFAFNILQITCYPGNSFAREPGPLAPSSLDVKLELPTLLCVLHVH